jgi:[protein-PII] uridylyltransferase
VHADDDAGLLYRLAATFADLRLDVRIAKVATRGRRVVDVFYLRDPHGAKLDDDTAIDELRTALTASVGR